MGLLRFVEKLCLLAAVAMTPQLAAQLTTSLRLLQPVGIATDAAGNLFIADTRRNQIIEWTIGGTQLVVAGSGAQGFSGDGGAATAALLNAPEGVAVGADGTVYVADTGNQRVRAVSGGIITTIAGSGVRGYSGDGAAAVVRFAEPRGLTLDAVGALLIADAGNQRIRRIAAGQVTTLAGDGTQGFAGDGGQATKAHLDSPAGVAVTSDGRVIIADTRNDRIRVIARDGTIATIAGRGVRGFDGDGGAAMQAALSLPRAVAVAADGGMLIVDSNNQRIRKIDTAGIISTVSGSGLQGTAADGTAAIAASFDTPRGVAVGSAGPALIADTRNRRVAALPSDNNIYGEGNPRPASVDLTAEAPLVYGSGQIAVATTSAHPAVTGNITLSDGNLAIGSAALNGGVAIFSTANLGAGQHTLAAVFSGDGLHASASSAATPFVVVPAQVVAQADGAAMMYGSATPKLSGTVTGVLPRDAASVGWSFVAAAPDLAPVGTYPITALLTGAASGNYAVSAAPDSGQLTVTQAPVRVSLAPPGTVWAGTSLPLTATVASTTRGTPTGAVKFFDNGTVVAVVSQNSGVANAVYTVASSGTHVLSAAYGGDANFLAGVSAPLSITAGDLPDFSVELSGASAQTVNGGALASFPLQLSAQHGAFTGSVQFSIAGLPLGAKASFSPAAVVPGGGTATVTLSIQTLAVTALHGASASRTALAGILVGLVLLRRRRGPALLLLLLVAALGGCGARTVADGLGSAKTYPMVVTATSTNLAGVVVTHSVALTLTVN